MKPKNLPNPIKCKDWRSNNCLVLFLQVAQAGFPSCRPRVLCEMNRRIARLSTASAADERLSGLFSLIGTLAILQHSGHDDRDQVREPMLRAARSGRNRKSCAKIYGLHRRGQVGFCPHKQWEIVERRAEILWLNGPK